MSEATPSFGELARASLKVGCLGFGGPAGQIALMHRIFVDEKKWIDEARYLHALNYCMLLPGPEAQQLATYVGWLLHGVRGGVVAGALFVLPGALTVLGLSWLYVTQGQTPIVAALFYGVKAAVVAFIVDALWRIGKRALKARADAIVAALAFVALYVFGVPFTLVILAAGLFGAIVSKPLPATGEPGASPSAARALQAALVWGAAWLAPVAIVIAYLGPDHVLSAVSVLFSQLALVTFGGAYAVLAYLQQQAVDVHAWLTPGQMIDGLGLAETTPGPLILVNQFVGFIAGWQAQGGGLGLALAAAALASWCTFAPSFVWIFAGAPYAEHLRRNRFAAGALRAVTAAVLGVIASLALWFAQHVLFTQTTNFDTPWGRALHLPALASFDVAATAIAFVAAVALIRFKANAALVVLMCAAAGWALTAL
ncbi:chromate transport protein ChrA [alpha proteobacterium U9-1i]|nr:chromate transport protein ChrA [alpha proteobacterium U9-1i]